MTLEVFDIVQAELGGKPRPRTGVRHPFMGLLTCARCGCAMTAEKKKGKYIYYRCTAFRGKCGNTYIRQEALAGLLGGIVEQVQIPAALADQIAERLRAGQSEVEQARQDALTRLTHRQ